MVAIGLPIFYLYESAFKSLSARTLFDILRMTFPIPPQNSREPLLCKFEIFEKKNLIHENNNIFEQVHQLFTIHILRKKDPVQNFRKIISWQMPPDKNC